MRVAVLGRLATVVMLGFWTSGAHAEKAKVSGPALGRIIGAVWDAKGEELHLLGDGDATVPAPDLQEIAVALRWASGRAETPGFVSINPHETDPRAPLLPVMMSPSLQNTRFGWTAFEADRLMKSLSLGSDSITEEPIRSKASGFKNMVELTAEHGADPARPTSRFWLSPGSHKTRGDARSIRIDEAKVFVETEIIQVVGGKIVSSGGARDPASDRYARFFSENYRAIANEYPVFARLEQLVRLMLIAEWARTRALSLDWSWIDEHAGKEHPIAAVTPALSVEAKYPTTGGVRIVQVYGGVSFETLQLSLTNTNLGTMNQAVVAAASSSVATPRRVTVGRESFSLLTIPPGAPGSAIQTPRPLVSERLPGGGTLVLYGRDPNDIDPYLYRKHDAVLALPRLLGENPALAERIRGARSMTQGWTRSQGFLGLAGGEQQRVPRRIYQLFAANGRRIASFPDALAVDGDRLVVRASQSDSSWKVSPFGKELARAWENTEHIYTFHVATGALIGEQIGNDLVRYHYNRHGVLDRVTTGGDNGERTPLFRGQHGNNGRRLLKLVRANGSVAAELSSVPSTSGKRKLLVTLPYDGASKDYHFEIDLATGTWSTAAASSERIQAITDLLSMLGPAFVTALGATQKYPATFAAGAFTLALSADRKRLAILDAPAEDTARVTSLMRREPGFRQKSPLEPLLRQGPPTKPERDQLDRLRGWLMRTASNSTGTVVF